MVKQPSQVDKTSRQSYPVGPCNILRNYISRQKNLNAGALAEHVIGFSSSKQGKCNNLQTNPLPLSKEAAPSKVTIFSLIVIFPRNLILGKRVVYKNLE